MFQFGALLGVFFNIKNGGTKALNFLIIGLPNFVLYMLINNSPIYNTRFLPFVIMSYILLGAVGLGELFSELFSRKKVIHVLAVVIFLG